MGVDLALLPFFDGTANFSNDILQVCRDYNLFDKIRALPQMEIDDDFNSFLSRDDEYEEYHYGITIEDCYGKRLTFVLAKDLKTVDIAGPVGAYIKALPDRHKVALYWH